MDDEHYMRMALQQAKLAFEEDEVPVGAIVVMNNRIIAKGYNQVEKLNDCTAHAEMIALTAAFNFLGNKYLPEATLFVTLEPCVMCSGAMYWSKIGRVVYGASDEKNGSITPLAAIVDKKSNWPFHPKTEVNAGLLKEESAELMKDFFKRKR